jgi:predicted GIY-YIG superfamily endonuclease
MSAKGTSPSPGRTAVYRLYDSEGQLLYIGISNNPPVRWSAHARERRWWKDVTYKAVVWYPTRREAEAVEEEAVPAEKPLYNIAHTPLHGRLSEWYCRDHLTEDEWATWRAADTLGVPGRRL